MATITITVSGQTTDETRTANWALDKANAARAKQSLPPYANPKEMLEDHVLNTMFPSWQRAEAEETANTDVKELWKAATDAQRAAAVVALTA